MRCPIDGTLMEFKKRKNPREGYPDYICYICPTCGASDIKETNSDKRVRLGLPVRNPQYEEL